MSSKPGATGPDRPQVDLTRIALKCDRDVLARLVVLSVVLVLSTALVSCSPPDAKPMPAAADPVAATPQPPPSSTPTRTLAPSATATAVPTLDGVVLPTPPPDGVSVSLNPDPEQTGWVSTSAAGLTPDNELNVGVLKGQAYSSLVQFDLSSLAPGSKILFAALELSGRNASNLGTDGRWNIDILDTNSRRWDQATFDTLRQTPALFSIDSDLPASELAAGASKTFEFTSDQLALLQQPLDNGSLDLRLSGPTEGSDDRFVWDATPGVRNPTLYLVVVPASFSVITSTPTPPDVFAAATRLVAQTLQAQLFGTPTPLPRFVATETPLPYVVYTEAPTAVNLAEAEATSSFATAVALTTGTPTALPLNWYTATPLPLSIPFVLLTPVPTATPTYAPLALPELAKRPLDPSLYNKIAFLSGDRSDPTAWIVDPDGSNLAELSDRTYYDIAAARDTVSPDGVWFLYNAPDQNDRLQIWRRDLVSSDVPAEQMTFHTRGFAYGAVWSPDGSQIAYTSTKDGREQEIFMFDLNDPHRWPRLSFSQDQYLWNQYPSWSPDGSKIAFSSDRGHIAAYTEIWVMNSDGSSAVKLGDGSRDAWAPVWIKWKK